MAVIDDIDDNDRDAPEMFVELPLETCAGEGAWDRFTARASVSARLGGTLTDVFFAVPPWTANTTLSVKCCCSFSHNIVSIFIQR